MSEIKLLPCPFCGGEAKLCDASSDNHGRYRVRCKEVACTLRPKTEWYETKEEAIRHWNHRRPMERILTRLKENEVGITFPLHPTETDYFVPSDKAIEIVKEEGGIE